jgi:hypothetical protein
MNHHGVAKMSAEARELPESQTRTPPRFFLALGIHVSVLHRPQTLTLVGPGMERRP